MRVSLSNRRNVECIIIHHVVGLYRVSITWYCNLFLVLLHRFSYYSTLLPCYYILFSYYSTLIGTLLHSFPYYSTLLTVLLHLYSYYSTLAAMLLHSYRVTPSFDKELHNIRSLLLSLLSYIIPVAQRFRHIPGTTMLNLLIY